MIGLSQDDRNDLQLYNFIVNEFKKMRGPVDQEDDDDHELDEDESKEDDDPAIAALMANDKTKASISLKHFISPIKDVNEFQFAIDIIREIKVGYFNS